MIAIALAVAGILLPGNGRPVFVPDRRSFGVSIILALAAAFMLGASAQLSFLFGWVQWGAVIAALLLGGTGLRPRGSRLRGLLLGANAYLIAGVVLVLIINQGSLGDLDLLAWVLQVLAWPGLLYLMLGGFG